MDDKDQRNNEEAPSNPVEGENAAEASPSADTPLQSPPSNEVPPAPEDAPLPEDQPPPPPVAGTAIPAGPQPPLHDSEARTYAMLGHVLTPVAGFIAPLVIWLIFKDRSEFVDAHGKSSLNFQITVAIGYVISFVLMAFCIGYLVFPAIWICSLVFAIIAGVEANKGLPYKYPFNINFIN